MSQEGEQSQLVVREWAAVFAMLLILTTVAVFSFSAKRDRLTPSISMISVQVVGAVAKSEELLLPAGASVADALVQVSLAENADTKKLILDMKLQQDQILVIPTQGKTSIFLTGAVRKKGLVLVPEECRYPDLIDYLTKHFLVQEDADLKQFKKKRRLLRDGEVVDIASKKKVSAHKVENT